ncbi:hypothetical protein Trydic_g22887 [Trypoxylus dichotomus]
MIGKQTGQRKKGSLVDTRIYSMPCSCDKVYIGTTGLSINTRRKKHEKCAIKIAEHVHSGQNHRVRFNDTRALTSIKNYYNRLNREAIEICKIPNKIKRDDGLRLNPI